MEGGHNLPNLLTSFVGRRSEIAQGDFAGVGPFGAHFNGAVDPGAHFGTVGEAAFLLQVRPYAQCLRLAHWSITTRDRNRTGRESELSGRLHFASAMSTVDQLFGAPDSVEAWERRARVRGLLMAQATGKMLDAARIGPGSRVLDVGTGAGDTALMAAERVGSGGHVLAIDASPAMVDQAMNKVRKSGLDYIDVRLMDGAHLEIDNASVDAVIGRNAMQFLPSWPDPLVGFHRVLRPGGRLAFVVWAPKELNPYFQLPIFVAQQHGFMRVPAATLETPYSLASADRLHADLEAAGFDSPAVERVVSDVQLADGTALLSYLRDGPMFRTTYDELDHSERSAFDRALETALERFREAEGYRVQATSLLATGTR